MSEWMCEGMFSACHWLVLMSAHWWCHPWPPSSASPFVFSSPSWLSVGPAFWNSVFPPGHFWTGMTCLFIAGALPELKSTAWGHQFSRGCVEAVSEVGFGAEWVFSKLPNPAELQENGIAVPVCLSLVRFSEVPGRNVHYKANCVREAI